VILIEILISSNVRVAIVRLIILFSQEASLTVPKHNPFLILLPQPGLDQHVLKLDDLLLAFVDPTTEYGENNVLGMEDEVYGLLDAE